MKDYYVYLHRKATDGEVFYVGKGRGRRAYLMDSRSDFHKRVVSKYGVKVEIVEDHLQEWYAYELEQNLISYYGKRIDGTGSLVNILDSAFVHVDYTEELLRIMSENTKNSFKNDPTRKIKNKEHLEKLRNSSDYKKSHEEFLKSTRKRVTMDNEICFFSIMDAAKFLGKVSLEKAISLCCQRAYGYRTVRGHNFCYSDQDYDEHVRIQNQIYSENIEKKRDSYTEYNQKRKVAVIVGGIYYDSFTNASLALFGTKDKANRVHAALSRGHKLKGLTVELAKEVQNAVDY